MEVLPANHAKKHARTKRQIAGKEPLASFRVFRGRLLRLGSLVTISAVLPLQISAPAPTLDYLFPAGGQQGSAFTLTVGGKFEPWPVKLWIDYPGVVFTTETNSGRVSVQIAKDVPLGPHFVRLFNNDGPSTPRIFVVGRLSELAEQEPNDNHQRAQFVEKLPVTINGRLEKSGDVDSFAVKIEAGRWLVAQVDAFALGSPVDPFLHLLDADGHRVAFANDTTNFDPLLAWRAEKSGTCIVQVAGFAHSPLADVRFAGSAATVYRLTITDGPFAHHTFPAGVKHGTTTALQLIGWNLAGDRGNAAIEFDATKLPMSASFAELIAPGAARPLRLAAGDSPEQLEQEPNNRTNEAQNITLPAVVNGCIQAPGDVDRFQFAAKQDEEIEFRVQSAGLGFPLDSSLRVETTGGELLRQNDDPDGGGLDSQMSWTAPSNGTFVVAISDLKHRGGRDFIYRLALGPPERTFRATVDNHSYRVEAGKSNEVKVTVTRIGGHKEKLTVRAENLPEGVSAPAVEVPERSGEVKLILSAAAEAKPSSQPLRVLVASEARTHRAAFNLRDKEAPGDLLLSEVADLWLTITAKPAPSAKTEEKKP
jgi:hypothetical protein